MLWKLSSLMAICSDTRSSDCQPCWWADAYVNYNYYNLNNLEISYQLVWKKIEKRIYI